MESPGYWGRGYFQPNIWPDNYWYEQNEIGEPYFLFYANKSFTFLGLKVFIFPATERDYAFDATKVFVLPVPARSYIFNADKLYIFNVGQAMTTPSTFEKLPTESFTIAVEWANQLPFSATLSSGTVAARKMDDNSDASAVVLTGTTATISGTQSRIRVQAGKVHTRYRILFSVTLSNGEVLQEAVYMQVREP